MTCELHQVEKNNSKSYIMTPIFFHHILTIDLFQISQDKIFFEKRALTLSGTGQDIFILLNLLDQILSADFFPKFSKHFWRWKLRSIELFWHPAKLIESYKSCPLVALK